MTLVHEVEVRDPVSAVRPVRHPRARRAVERTGGRATARSVTARLVLPLMGVGVIALAWEGVTRMGLVSTTVLPTLSDTLTELASVLGSADFWPFLLLTLRAWALGMLLAATVALPLGIWFGMSDRAYRFVRLPLEAVRPVPPIVILPLALLALGGGIVFQSTLIVQGAMWPLLITVVYGLRDMESVTLETARSFAWAGGAPWSSSASRPHPR